MRFNKNCRDTGRAIKILQRISKAITTLRTHRLFKVRRSNSGKRILWYWKKRHEFYYTNVTLHRSTSTRKFMDDFKAKQTQREHPIEDSTSSHFTPVSRTFFRDFQSKPEGSKRICMAKYIHYSAVRAERLCTEDLVDTNVSRAVKERGKYIYHREYNFLYKNFEYKRSWSFTLGDANKFKGDSTSGDGGERMKGEKKFYSDKILNQFIWKNYYVQYWDCYYSWIFYFFASIFERDMREMQ